MKLFVFVFLIVNFSALAQKNCQELGTDHAFFDGKQSRWLTTEDVKIFKCPKH